VYFLWLSLQLSLIQLNLRIEDWDGVLHNMSIMDGSTT